MSREFGDTKREAYMPPKGFSSIPWTLVISRSGRYFYSSAREVFQNSLFIFWREKKDFAIAWRTNQRRTAVTVGRQPSQKVVIVK